MDSVNREDKIRALLRAVTAEPSWNGGNLDVRDVPDEMHPALAATGLVREALSNFSIPGGFTLRFCGTQRKGGYGAHGVEEGVINIEATVTTPTGHHVSFDVPVIVKAGKMVYPAVLRKSGALEVLSQGAIDVMFEQGTLWAKSPAPGSQYSTHDNVREDYTPVQNRGIYATHNPEGLDPAERDYEEFFMAGDSARLVKETAIKLRGGTQLIYPAGTEVTILRDMQGDGQVYYVEFENGARASIYYDLLK